MKAPSPTSEWLPGAEVGTYRLERLLGQGGMGEVWAAVDTRLDRRVAIKRLLLQPGLDRDVRGRFMREARVQAAISSPHVATLYDLCDEPQADGADRPYLVMELVEGETLADRLARGPLEEADALRLLRQLAEGLCTAHRKGAVHRDLKPSNLMIRPDGTLVILDFGLASLKAPTAEGGHTLTRTGDVMGTPAYMSPEQLLGQQIGPQADVWACGAILFEMLTGQRPFAGGSLPAIAAAVLRDAPLALRDLAPNVSADVASLVDDCLAKDPARRPRDAGELLGRIPVSQLPLALASPILYSAGVLQNARVYSRLSASRAWALAGAGLLGIAFQLAATQLTWPEATRRPWLRLAEVEAKARSLAARLGVASDLEHSASGYGLGAAGVPTAWVRLSPQTLLDPARPPSLSFPPPTVPGELRLQMEATEGRLLLLERWAGESAGAGDQLAALLEGAGDTSGVTGLGPPSAKLLRGAPLRSLTTGRGDAYEVAEAGGEVLRFARSGVELPPSDSRLESPTLSFSLLAVLAFTGWLAARHLRRREADLPSAAMLGTAMVLFKMATTVFNPAATLPNGIWGDILADGLFGGAVVVLAYLAFEPEIRRRWPGMLAGWVRLARTRQPDWQVGRELLTGAALAAGRALLVAALALALPGRGTPAWASDALFGLGTLGIHGYTVCVAAVLTLIAALAVLLVASQLVKLVRLPWLALGIAGLASAVLDQTTGLEGTPWLVATCASGLLAAAAARLGGLLGLAVYLLAVQTVPLAAPWAAGTWTLPFTLASLLPLLAALAAGLALALRHNSPAPSTLEATAAQPGPTVGPATRPSRGSEPASTEGDATLPG